LKDGILIDEPNDALPTPLLYLCGCGTTTEGRTIVPELVGTIVLT